MFGGLFGGGKQEPSSAESPPEKSVERRISDIEAVHLIADLFHAFDKVKFIHGSVNRYDALLLKKLVLRALAGIQESPEALRQITSKSDWAPEEYKFEKGKGIRAMDMDLLPTFAKNEALREFAKLMLEELERLDDQLKEK